MIKHLQYHYILAAKRTLHCAAHYPVFITEQAFQPTVEGTAAGISDDFAQLAGIDTLRVFDSILSERQLTASKGDTHEDSLIVGSSAKLPLETRCHCVRYGFPYTDIG